MILYNIIIILILAFVKLISTELEIVLFEERINELKNLGKYLKISVKDSPATLPCTSFYEYACSKGKQPYPSIGEKLSNGAVKNLIDEIESSQTKFASKTKLLNFFYSCKTYKNIDQCYEEVLKYFKTMLAYGALTFNINTYDDYLYNTSTVRLLNKFEESEFRYLRAKQKLEEKLRLSDIHKQHINVDFLNNEYDSFVIDPNHYHQNILNMNQTRSQHKKHEHFDLIDFLLLMFQTHNKPLIYFYPTFNTHLWVYLYDEIYHNRTKLQETLDCLQMDSNNALNIVYRKMAAVFYSAVRTTLNQYNDWLKENPLHAKIDESENEILRNYKMSTKRIYFIILAQSFCKYGKEILENSILQGYRHSDDFQQAFHCAPQSPMNPTAKCDL